MQADGCGFQSLSVRAGRWVGGWEGMRRCRCGCGKSRGCSKRSDGCQCSQAPTASRAALRWRNISHFTGRIHGKHSQTATSLCCPLQEAPKPCLVARTMAPRPPASEGLRLAHEWTAQKPSRSSNAGREAEGARLQAERQNTDTRNLPVCMRVMRSGEWLTTRQGRTIARRGGTHKQATGGGDDEGGDASVVEVWRLLHLARRLDVGGRGTAHARAHACWPRLGRQRIGGGDQGP